MISFLSGRRKKANHHKTSRVLIKILRKVKQKLVKKGLLFQGVIQKIRYNTHKKEVICPKTHNLFKNYLEIMMDLAKFMNHSSILLKKAQKKCEKIFPLQRQKPFIKVFPFLCRNFEQIKVLPMRNNTDRPQKIDFFFESA